MPSTNPYQVVIDDLDSQIHYTGPSWFPHNTTDDFDGVGTNGDPYLHTLHGTTVNSSLSFSFQGTLITVVGTMNQTNISGVPDPTWECFVDGINIGVRDPPTPESIESNWILCDRATLTDGSHELTLNVFSAGQTFWFDKILYRPSPSLSFGNVVYLVENTELGISFDSDWETIPTGEANMTQTYGSTATFNFTGTKVDWLGTIPVDAPDDPSMASYSIDGGVSTPFNLKGGAIRMVDQIFFSTPDLTAGPHILQVTYQGNSQQTPLTLDYLYLTSTSSTNTSTSSNSSPTDTSISSASSTTGTSTSNASSPVDTNISRPSATVNSLGPIVGGAVGGTVGLIVLALVVLWLYRRRWKHARHNAKLAGTENTMRSPQSEVTPYIYGASSNATHGSSVQTDQSSSSQRLPWGDAPPRYTKV